MVFTRLKLKDGFDGFSFKITGRKDGSVFKADVVDGCICVRQDCKTNLKAIYKAMCIYDKSVAKSVRGHSKV